MKDELNSEMFESDSPKKISRRSFFDFHIPPYVRSCSLDRTVSWFGGRTIPRLAGGPSSTLDESPYRTFFQPYTVFNQS